MSTFTAEPTRTYAVVVAVETYRLDPSKDLDGPANDAARFIGWLTSRGVPAGNIDLLASPKSEVNARLLGQTGVPIKPATRQSVRDEFLVDLPNKPQQPCGLLWLFWAGHGLATGPLQRRLILEDASGRNCENLDVESLLTYLRGHVFARLPRQIALIDACANYTPHLADPLTFPREQDLQADCRQFVMFGAGLGERAGNRNQVGVFSNAVLEALDQPHRGGSFPPDIEPLARGLMDRFTDLRAHGQVRQTPVIYEYRNWEGSRWMRYADVPAPFVPGALPPVGADAVPLPLQDELTSALLDCEVILRPYDREDLLMSLPREIKIHVRDSRNPLLHVRNIVRTCLDYPGGLEFLADRVCASEMNAEKVRRIDDCIERIHNRPR